MSSNTVLISLRAQRTSLLNSTAALVTKGLRTEEQKRAHAANEAAIADLDSRISSLELIDAKLAERKSAQPAPATAAQVAAIPAEVRRVLSLNADGSDDKIALANRAWAKYLRTGMLDGIEQRDILVNTDASGGALVPQEFLGSFVESLKFYGPIADLALMKGEDEKGRPVKFPVYNDTASAMTLVAEGTSTSGAEADPVVFSTVPNTDGLVTRLDYSVQFSDNAFDLASFIKHVAAVRVARALEVALTNSTDNSAAKNVLPNSISGGLFGVATNAGTLTTAGAVAYADAAKLYSAVDPAYRVNGVFMAHQSVNDYLAKQVDSTGRPLYNVDADGNLLLVAGKKLVINQAMPALTSTGNAAQIGFGDLSKTLGYVFGGLRIKVLEERYADQLLRSAVIYTRFGSTKLDAANAFKFLTV